eukprot:scaffold45757_cov22-Tisochrysis_lutea.AAC.1
MQLCGGVASGEAEATQSQPLPRCPPAASPPLASLATEGRPVRLTFINLARYPLRLVFLGADGEAVDAGAIEPHGAARTFDSADTHAWAARTFRGETVLELEPRPGDRPKRHIVDIEECDLAAAREPAKQPLHEGWR